MIKLSNKKQINRINFFTRLKGLLSRVDKALLLLIIIFLLSIPAITPRIYSSDEIQYFVYLRSVLMDGDLNFENEYRHFVANNPEEYQEFVKAYLQKRTPTGYPPNYAPIGCSILWSPFFGFAHLYVKVSNSLGTHIAADGYSAPYIRAVTFGSALLGFIGIVLIYILCRRYFAPFNSSWAVLTAWLASSLIFYMYITPPMSHSSSFFIVSLFIFLWLSGYRRRTLKGWLLLGLIGGLMYIVREQNGLFLLLPLIEAVECYIDSIRKKDLPAGGKLLGQNILFAIAFLFTLIPQFLTYKVLNGNYHPSELVAGHLNFLSPKPFSLLFSSYHGFFSWTPIALVGVVGLVFFYQRQRRLALVLASVFILQVYVSSCYSSWWAGVSFGARRLINCIPIIAIGLAAVSENLRRKISAKILVAIGLIFIVWNLFFIIQYSTYMVPRDQPISFKKMVYNQFFQVPPKLYSLGKRYLFDRQSFYKIKNKILEAADDENLNGN